MVNVVTINLRADVVPNDLIVFYHSDNALPTNYVHETNLFSNFYRGSPGACNPNVCIGTTTHNHTTVPAHVHPGTFPSHSAHTATHGNSTINTNASSNVGSAASSTHTHTINVGGTSGNADVSSTATNTHPTFNNDPNFIATRHIRSSAADISMRSKQLPINASILWFETVASVPTNFSIATFNFGTFTEGVAAACTAVGGTGGVTAHQHGNASANHTHSLNIAGPDVHSHNLGTTSGHSGNVADGGGGNVAQSYAQGHSHTAGTGALNNNAAGNVTSTGGGITHDHASTSQEPPFTTGAIITKTGLDLRGGSFPNLGAAMWLGTLGSIPADYFHQNGTSSTIDLRCDFIKGIPNACTNPGTTGGATAHTHANAGAHTHTGTISHTHPLGGTVSPSPTGPAFVGSATVAASRQTHAHNLSGTSGATNVAVTATSAGDHGHGSGTHLPPSKTVAYIQRRL